MRAMRMCAHKKRKCVYVYVYTRANMCSLILYVCDLYMACPHMYSDSHLYVTSICAVFIKLFAYVLMCSYIYPPVITVLVPILEAWPLELQFQHCALCKISSSTSSWWLDVNTLSLFTWSCTITIMCFCIGMYLTHMLCGGNNCFLINKENLFIFVGNYVYGDFGAHDPSPSTLLKLMSTRHSSGLELGDIKISLLVLVTKTNNLSQYTGI